MTDLPEMIPADPRLRRNALLILLGGTVIGSAFIVWVLPQIQDVLLNARATGQVSARTICLGFVGVIAMLVAPVSIAGVSVIRTAKLTVDSAQFPAPGAKVIRDTRILRGSRAVTLGRVQRILGALLVACALALLALCTYAAILLL